MSEKKYVRITVSEHFGAWDSKDCNNRFFDVELFIPQIVDENIASNLESIEEVVSIIKQELERYLKKKLEGKPLNDKEE